MLFVRGTFCVLVFWASLFFASNLLAETPAGKAAEESHSVELRCEHSKLNTEDATPVDPGHFEFEFAYGITGSRKTWNSRGHSDSRPLFRENAFDTVTTIGLIKNVDVAISQGYRLLMDKTNNYNEFAGMIDAGTGEEMEDETDGPHHGHGLTDLSITGRWRFYNNEQQALSFAYMPNITVPTGRWTQRNRLGPSQEFASMGNTLVMTKDFGRFTTNTNLAYTAPLCSLRKSGNSVGLLETKFAIGYHVFDWLQPAVEINYGHEFFRKDSKGADLVTMVFGLIFCVHEHARFEAGLTQDIAGRNTDQTTGGIFKAILMF